MVSIKINQFGQDNTCVCTIKTNERPNGVKNFNSELSNERPDVVISSLEGVKWLHNQDFGEAKCSGESDNNYLTNMSLIRLVMFSKMSISTHSIRGILNLQSIVLQSPFTLPFIHMTIYTSCMKLQKFWILVALMVF